MYSNWYTRCGEIDLLQVLLRGLLNVCFYSERTPSFIIFFDFLTKLSWFVPNRNLQKILIDCLAEQIVSLRLSPFLLGAYTMQEGQLPYEDHTKARLKIIIKF